MCEKNCENCGNHLGERSEYTNETCIAEEKSKLIVERGNKTDNYMWCKGKKHI